MAANPIPDPTQQPQIDPAVLARIQALVAAHQAAQNANMPAPSAAPVDMPVAPPQLPAPQGMVPNAPTPTVQPAQPAPQMAPQAPQFPAPATPDVTKTPVKGLLGSILYGAGQAALKHVGLETDAEKQQRLAMQSVAQQNAASEASLRQAQSDLYSGKNDALAQNNEMVPIPNNPVFGALAGTQVRRGDLPKILTTGLTNQGKSDVQNEKDINNIDVTKLKYGDGSNIPYTRRGFANVDGKYITYDKADPMNTAQVIGTANSITSGVTVANARAAAQARYGLTPALDENNNPTSISRLDAIQNGIASVPFDAAKGLASDRVGIQQYRNILDSQITPNLAVLNDPQQRAIIAHTLSEADKNPGMFQSIVTAGMQNGGLSPAGAKLAAGIMQGREFGSVARKYGGNMNGTEGLMNRIVANQASPLNSVQLNQDLIQNDRNFTDKAMTALSGVTSHRAGVKTPSAAPAAPSGGWGAQFGAVPLVQK